MAALPLTRHDFHGDWNYAERSVPTCSDTRHNIADWIGQIRDPGDEWRVLAESLFRPHDPLLDSDSILRRRRTVIAMPVLQ
jgi:hypothetical protein